MDISNCSSSRAHWRVTLLDHPCLCGEQEGLCSLSHGNTGKVCMEIPSIKALHKEAQLHFPVIPMTHWSIQHLSVVASQSPVSFQAVSKVTGLSQPTFPCCLCCRPLDTLPCVQCQTETPFPAWILSLEKRNEILFVFFFFIYV